MSYNFKACDRDQRFLLPPDMRDWLPEDHLAFFVLDTVESLNLSSFLRSYREDGWGRAAFDPQMMVALVLYAFCVGERSTRRIERRCMDDIGFRVITATHKPDHSTIARFIARHHDALQDLFSQVVGVCVRAGLVRTDTVAIDGTKMAANASEFANISEERLAEYARRVFEEAAAVDAEEDKIYGDRRGDEMPSFLSDRGKRLEWIREQLVEQQRRRDDDAVKKRTTKQRRDRKVKVNTTDPDSRGMKTPEGFVQGYNAQAVVTEDQIVIAAGVTNHADDAGHFQPMVAQAQRNLGAAGAEGIGTVVADAGYFTVANIEAELGCQKLIAPVASAKIDERIAETAERQRSEQIKREERTRQLGEEDDRRILVLSQFLAGQITLKKGAQLLGLSIPRAYVLKDRLRNHGPDSIRRRLPPAPRPPSPTDTALAKFQTPESRATYAMRSITVEPVFGQIKESRGVRRFLRRGLTGCNTDGHSCW